MPVPFAIAQRQCYRVNRVKEVGIARGVAIHMLNRVTVMPLADIGEVTGHL